MSPGYTHGRIRHITYCHVDSTLNPLDDQNHSTFIQTTDRVSFCNGRRSTTECRFWKKKHLRCRFLEKEVPPMELLLGPFLTSPGTQVPYG